MDIDWSKAPEGAIGAFTRGHETFFVKTRELSEYMNKPGYSGIQCDGDEYHVFTEYWVWSERPVAWNGEGLPPVGAVCECQNEELKWLEGTIVHVGYHGSTKLAVMQAKEEILYGEVGEFRPIKTKEQLAAEEREQVIREMRHIAEHDAHSREVDYGALYDAGYRKQEIN